MNLKRVNTVHLLGNGPSVSHFTPDESGICVTCNLGHLHINPAWTFINAGNLGHICETQRTFETPIVVESHYLQRVRLGTLHPQHLKTLNFFAIIKPFKQIPAPSTGHKATWYALKLYKPVVLHLWGLDSLWTDDNQSLQDEIFGLVKDDTFQTTWRPAWETIWSTNSKTQFVIHTPTPIENLPKNVATERV